MRLKTRIVVATAIMFASFANFAEDSGIGMNIVPAPKKVVIDGKLDEWTLTAPVNYCVDPNSFDQKVKTYAMWDDQNLYLAYEVRDSSPLKNNGSDPTSAFKTGDSMHFYLSTDKELKTKRAEGGPSDYHVLMSVLDGKPLVYCFREKKSGTEKPVIIKSPATSISIDWMGPVSDSEMAVQTAADKSGYSAEIRIPWAFFDNYKPSAGAKFAADAAVNFSDATGTKNVSKIWWHRGGAQTLDIPTELRFDRNLWGEAVLRGPGETPIVISNSNFFLVPAPVKMEIDGDLEDWDMSCAYGPQYVDASLKDKYNATWAAMYDNDALYLGAVFKSAQPMTNDGGVDNVWWRGDSLEFRLSADPKNQYGDIKNNMDILTFGIWYNDKEKKDYIALQRSFSFIIDAPKGIVVKSKEIAGGRSFEARVPWSILKSGNCPKAGDSIAMTLAAIWKNGLRAYGMGSISSFRGMNDWGKTFFLDKGFQKLVFVDLPQPQEKASAAEIKCKTSIQVPRKGLLSAGVYSADGRLLRTLFSGRVAEAGALEIGWDGMTDDAKPAVAGKYQVRSVLNAGLAAKYVTSACSPGKPPYESPDPLRGWGGVWGNVVDIASDNDGIFPLWAEEEGDGALLHLDEDGNLRWRQHIPLALNGHQSALAVNKDFVYVAMDFAGKNEGRAGLWRVRRSDGYYAPFPNSGSDPMGFYLEGVKRPVAEKGKEALSLQIPQAVTGMAADDKTLFVSAYHQNQLMCFDAQSGKPIKSFPVDQPRGVCIDPAGGLLVVSGKQVLHIDTASGQISTVLEKGLDSPFHIAADGKGRILVSDRGASQQIKRFDRKGTLQGVFGKAGGRDNNGKYETDRLLNPAGVTVAASGKIFFTEDTYPRVFVRLSEALNHEKLWAGPWYLSGEVTVDPAIPEQVYIWGFDSVAKNQGLMRHVIDYQNHTSRPDAVWTNFALPLEKSARWFPRVINHAGKKYLFCGGSAPCLYRIDGDKVLQIAAIGVDMAKDKSSSRWIFTDLNENGKIDEGEMKIVPQRKDDAVSLTPSYWGGSIDERDMTIYFMTSDWTKKEEMNVYAFTPTFAKPGIPLYSFDNFRKIPQIEAHKPGVTDHLSSIWHAQDGGVFGNADLNGSDPKGIGHSSHLSDVFVYRLDRDGKLLWRAGSKASGIAKNGEFYGRACGLAGPIAGEYFSFVDENGQDKVYTNDGLFVGNLLNDSAVATPSEYTLLVEHFNSIVYQNAIDKKWYFTAGASGYASIWEITGLDLITRLSTEITLK